MNEKTLERMRSIATTMTMVASRMVWDGKTAWRGDYPIEWERFLRLSICDVPEVGTRLMFTRDVGHHTSGWLKNPDYERCWHLSVSGEGPPKGLIVVPESQILTPAGNLPAKQSDLDADVEKAWVECFFKDAVKYVWRESAKSTEGRAKNVWHYRVFADEQWKAIVPRGEVYSTLHTDLGWQSWSDLHAEGKGPEVISTVDPG